MNLTLTSKNQSHLFGTDTDKQILIFNTETRKQIHVFSSDTDKQIRLFNIDTRKQIVCITVDAHKQIHTCIGLFTNNIQHSVTYKLYISYNMIYFESLLFFCMANVPVL